MVIQTKAILEIVTFIARYYFKATGSIVYQVRSENNEEYCVTLNTNGTTGCYNKATGEECAGHKYAHRAGHDCHHVIDCQTRENERKQSECQTLELAEIDLRPNADGNYRNLLTYCLALEEQASQPVDTTDLIIDAEYEQWKRENDLDGYPVGSLTEEQVEAIARYELAVL